MNPHRTSYPQAPRETSGLAIASLVMGLVGFCVPILGLAGLICGHLSLSKIRKSDGTIGGRGLAIGGLVTGYLATALWALYVGAMVFGFATLGRMDREMKEEAGMPFPLGSMEIPGFPSLPEGQVIEPSGVRVSQVELTAHDGPGKAMSLRVYLPKGDPAPASLPCVLMAPAGTNLLSGAELDPLNDDAYHLEALPYAEAGFAVVLYSIDGEDPEEETTDEKRGEEMKRAYEAFRAAGAGTVNGRNAFEFVLRRIPVVDPGKVYAAGHSSAATLALLVAAHEPRLKGCIAYAPALDIEGHFSDLLNMAGIDEGLPGVEYFAKRSSPMTHAGRIQAPVFLFFAEDDTVAPLDPIDAFMGKVRASNPDVSLKVVKEGGHYNSMIREGIPAGIEWIRAQEGKAKP
jgi:dienelactone hydrolase